MYDAIRVWDDPHVCTMELVPAPGRIFMVSVCPQLVGRVDSPGFANKQVSYEKYASYSVTRLVWSDVLGCRRMEEEEWLPRIKHGMYMNYLTILAS